MRVVHYCKRFSEISETFIYDYIVELEHRGVDNYVLTNSHINQGQRPFPKVVELKWLSGWDVPWLTRLALAGIGFGDRRNAAWPIIRRRMSKAIHQLQPDVLHAHFGDSGAVIAPLARQLKIPLLVSFHGFDASKLIRDPFWSPRIVETISAADMVTVVSEEMKASLDAKFQMDARLRVVRVGKRLEDYEFHVREARPIKHWLSVGRLIEKKGHFDCIRAFQRLLPAYPDMTLTIIGGGELSKSLHRHVTDNRLSKHVRLIGVIPHEDVKRVMETSDALILCSKMGRDGDKEGVPTVLMEAQALGLPCVSTRHSGIPEVIPEENHWLLAKEGEVSDIAARMKRLLECPTNERNKLTRRGREKIELEFNLSIIGRDLEMIYQDLCQSGPSKN
jgi:glycosyltransferase involved in cell wall biosynthesis